MPVKRIAKLFQKENGLTLIEVLAVLAISGIVLTVFYNVFLMGIKTYEKVGVEVKLRDEADYVLSDLLDVLNETQIDKVEDCSSEFDETPCLRFTQNKKMNVKKGIFIEESVEDSEEASEDLIITTFIFDKHVQKIKTENNETKTETLISDPYELVMLEEEEGKTASFSCIDEFQEDENSCTSGLIDMTIKIQDANFSKDKPISVEPMILKSRFGF